MFIDPASTKTGWAIFDDFRLLNSGSISATGNDVFKRLSQIAVEYATEIYPYNYEEIHFENIPVSNRLGKQAVMRPLMYSIGAIGQMLYRDGLKISVDIPVKSWQKYVDWNGERTRLCEYENHVESEDELAAIGMGLWYVNIKAQEDVSDGKRKKVRRGKVKNGTNSPRTRRGSRKSNGVRRSKVRRP
jgi:hypothetical protein